MKLYVYNVRRCYTCNRALPRESDICHTVEAILTNCYIEFLACSDECALGILRKLEERHGR